MPTIQSICHWLQHTEWSQDVLQSSLLFPFIEGSHIMALAISVGLVLILDLRLLNMGFSIAGRPPARAVALDLQA